jgi:nitric oxide reductase subunit B
METYQTTFTIKRLWTILAVGMVVMFGVLLLLGSRFTSRPRSFPRR